MQKPNSSCNLWTKPSSSPCVAAVVQDDSAYLVELLVDHGADIEAVEEKYGCTPLLTAANNNNTKGAKALLGELGLVFGCCYWRGCASVCFVVS